MVSLTKRDRTSPYSGLTAQQVKLNRQKYGTNILTPPQRDPWWKLYLAKFADPVIRILIMAAAIAISVGIFEDEYAEALGIILAIFLATTLAFINEYKASQEFELLNYVYDQVPIKVIRDGHFTTIPRKDIVVGDIVYLEQGEEIPADGIILEEVSLYIDQAKITGESDPIKKWTQEKAKAQTLEEALTYPAYNLYRSTIVAQGHGFFQVTAVGDRTEIGQLATTVATIETGETTTLHIQLEKLSQLIGIVGLSVSGLIFLALLVRGFVVGELILTLQQGYFVLLLVSSVLVTLIPIWLPVIYDGFSLINPALEFPNWLKRNSFGGWLKTAGMALFLLLVGIAVGSPLGLIPNGEQSWLPYDVGKALLNYFMVAVTIIVVAVPEGLAMSVTLSLAYSMRKMAASHNLVRRMHACETIGAATVICSDKTGTLTRNQMRVQEVHFPCLHSPNPPQLKYYQSLVAEAIALNSTANLEKQPQQPPHPIGNVTEGALLLWLDSQDLDYLSYRHRCEIKLQMTFSAQKKYMATLGTSSVINSDV
ncbi:MAG: HAD-IC family P-type ATPase, partial [Microcystaceae cyanobacterium]